MAYKPLTNEELKAIEARVEESKEYGQHVAELALDDVPRLLAEINRLRGIISDFHLASTVLLSQIDESPIPEGAFHRGVKLLKEACENV
jgi:hypothetical protein